MSDINIDCPNCDTYLSIWVSPSEGEMFGHCDECGWSVETVQNTPKNRSSESQQNQGVKSSDLGVQKGNVL